MKRLGAIGGALLASTLGCGDPPSTPVPKVDPKVTLHPLPREILGTSLAATVEVSGCDRVSRVRLRDRDQLLEEVEAYGAVTEVSVPSNHLPLKQRGLAADLALFAEAECDDGRKASSRESPVTFMPAKEVLAGPWEFGTNFWVEGSGETFLGCAGDLVRLSKQRSLLSRAELGFDCDGNTEIAFGGDGSIVALEPGRGFAVLNDDLTTRVAATVEGIEQLLTPPDSGKPLVALVDNGVLRRLVGFDPATGERRWGPVDLSGLPAGRLAYSQGRVVYPSYWLQQTGSDLVDVGLTGFDVETGVQSSQLALGTAKAEMMGPLTLPTVSLDSTASTAFFSDLAGEAVVRACEVAASRGCTELGGGLIWRSDPLIGGVTQATRTADALVAWGERVAYFLDPATGRNLGEAIVPSGSLVFTFVLGAKGGSTLLLAQAPGEAGIKQVLIFDEPSQQVASYVTGTEGYVIDVDGLGHPWLWKYDLARLFPASEYRRALR